MLVKLRFQEITFLTIISISLETYRTSLHQQKWLQNRQLYAYFQQLWLLINVDQIVKKNLKNKLSHPIKDENISTQNTEISAHIQFFFFQLIITKIDFEQLSLKYLH